jgi:hypothetical protein
VSNPQTTKLPTVATDDSSENNVRTIFDQMAEKIIAQQEAIIGPVAIEQAKGVPGLKVDWPNHKVTITGDAAGIIDKLVQRYKELFGKISVEVCEEATSGLLSKVPDNQRPKSLTS